MNEYRKPYGIVELYIAKRQITHIYDSLVCYQRLGMLYSKIDLTLLSILMYV